MTGLGVLVAVGVGVNVGVDVRVRVTVDVAVSAIAGVGVGDAGPHPLSIEVREKMKVIPVTIKRFVNFPPKNDMKSLCERFFVFQVILPPPRNRSLPAAENPGWAGR